jgi:hypothetical protein
MFDRQRSLRWWFTDVGAELLEQFCFENASELNLLIHKRRKISSRFCAFWDPPKIPLQELMQANVKLVFSISHNSVSPLTDFCCV